MPRLRAGDDTPIGGGLAQTGGIMPGIGGRVGYRSGRAVSRVLRHLPSMSRES
jgi:hypothetical protein